MKKTQFSIEISGEIKEEYLSDIFHNLSKYQKELFREEKIYLTFNDNNIAKIVLNKISEIQNISIIEKNPQENFQKSGTIIFPYPSNPNIYDVISIYTKNIINIEKKDFVLEKQKDLNYHFENEAFCKTCYKTNARELDFCIFCGNYIHKVELLESFSIKISSIDGVDTKVNLAKFLSKHSSNKDFKLVLEYLTKVPTIFNFSSTRNYFQEFCNLLDKYHIIYSILDSSSFNIEKFFYSFKSYGSLNLGVISKKTFLDPILSKLASDVLKEMSFDNLKRSLTNCLYEVYTIINIFRKNEDNHIYSDIEKNLEDLLKKFFLLIRKSQELNNYLNEHSLEKINKEIEELNNKKENILDKEIIKIYDETIIIKEKEYNEFLSIEKSLEVLKSQVYSVSALLGAMKTKIIYINNSPIAKNKKELSEINSIKENLVLKIEAIQEVLDI